MPLLSVRVHRRRGDGCYFLADEFQCVLAFPTFAIEIDDTVDCVVPFMPTNRKEGTESERLTIDYDDSVDPEQRVAFAREASQLVASRGAVPTSGLLRFQVRKAQARSQARLELNHEVTEGTLPTCRVMKTPRQSRRKQQEGRALPPPINSKTGSSRPLFAMGEEDLGFERDLMAELNDAEDDDALEKVIDDMDMDDYIWENDTVCSSTASETSFEDDDVSSNRGSAKETEREVPLVIDTSEMSNATTPNDAQIPTDSQQDSGSKPSSAACNDKTKQDETSAVDDNDDGSLPIPRSGVRIPTIYIPESHVKRTSKDW